MADVPNVGVFYAPHIKILGPGVYNSNNEPDVYLCLNIGNVIATSNQTNYAVQFNNIRLSANNVPFSNAIYVEFWMTGDGETISDVYTITKPSGVSTWNSTAYAYDTPYSLIYETTHTSLSQIYLHITVSVDYNARKEISIPLYIQSDANTPPTYYTLFLDYLNNTNADSGEYTGNLSLLLPNASVTNLDVVSTPEYPGKQLDHYTDSGGSTISYFPCVAYSQLFMDGQVTPAVPIECGTVWSAVYTDEYAARYYNTSNVGIDSQQITLNTDYPVLCAYSEIGKSFDGWYRNISRTGTCYQNGDIIPASQVTGDISLYAKCTTMQYTVRFYDFDGEGNTLLNTQTCDYGTAATAPTTPTRTGYNFVGWSNDFSYITANIDVYGQWTPIISSDQHLWVRVNDESGGHWELYRDHDFGG